MILHVVDGVTFAVQLSVVMRTTPKSTLLPLTTLSPFPSFVMATDPAGVEAVPGEMLSLTNTVHVTCWPTATEEGEHVTTVDVARKERKRVVYGESVDIGGRRIIKKKNKMLMMLPGIIEDIETVNTVSN